MADERTVLAALQYREEELAAGHEQRGLGGGEEQDRIGERVRGADGPDQEVPAHRAQDEAHQAAAQNWEQQPEVGVLQSKEQVGRMDGLYEQDEQDHDGEPGSPSLDATPHCP